MILKSMKLDTAMWERETGWAIKPQGACKGERCVPLGPQGSGEIDVRRVAERLGMPLVEDAATGTWSVGPEAGGRALASAEAPEIVLPTVGGEMWDLRSLRGTKVLLVAWASW
ncbi:MAG: hypothetical protein NVS2B7_07860 [Herpetosiphon sp.]